MAKSLIAVSNIKTKQGYISAGQPVPEKLLSKDEIRDLVEKGAVTVGDVDDVAVDDLIDQYEEVVDYDALTVEQLKAKLADRDLPVSGTKAELVDRLVASDDSELVGDGSAELPFGDGGPADPESDTE